MAYCERRMNNYGIQHSIEIEFLNHVSDVRVLSALLSKPRYFPGLLICLEVNTCSNATLTSTSLGIRF
jgi:hypothetical protein